MIRKILRAAASISLLGAFPLSAVASHEGVVIEAGQIDFSHPDEHTLDIHQSSDTAILSWPAFSIPSGHTFNFHQPSLTSSALNRDFSGNSSQILGDLNANGRLFIENPAGIFFGSSASINVGALIASTLHLPNENFLSGSYVFKQLADSKPASIVNEGMISTQKGGAVALLGGSVRNEGTIEAKLGSITMASGEQMTLSFDPKGLISIAVDKALQQKVLEGDGQEVRDAVHNAGALQADGGKIQLTAGAASELFDHLVNQTGRVQANSLVERNGVIELAASNGSLENSGTLSAEGTAGNPKGGFISLQGETIIQKGRISANAQNEGVAGEIRIVSTQRTLLAPGSLVESKGDSIHSSGGKVLIDSLEGQTFFERGAAIDVSGGTLSGDAGFVEISGKDLEFGGRILGGAPEGYTAGRLLVDPLNLIFNTSTQTSPPNNASPTPDIAFNDAPANGATTVQIADIVGFAEARFEATQDITVNNALTMNNNNDLVLRAGRDINLNANVRVQGGSGHMTLTADADFSGNGGAASDGIGSISQAAGVSILSGNGNMALETGGDFTMRTITGGSSGTVSITSSQGNLLDDGDTSTVITGGALSLTANAAGKGVGTAGALNTNINTLNLNVGSGGAALVDIGSYIFNAPTVASGGSLDLRTNGSLTIAANAAVSVSGAGTLNLMGDSEGNGTGTLVMNSGSSLSTAGGNITLSGADDMTLRSISAGSGNLSITTVGSGTDINDDGDNTTKFTANVLTLTAGGRIGNTGNNQIDSSVNELNATSSAGSLFLANDKTLLVTTATATGSGNDVTLTTTSGDLNISQVQAADDITLDAAGAIEESGADAASDLTGDLLTLTAGTGIGSLGVIETNSGSLALTTGSLGAFLTDSDSFTLNTSSAATHGSLDLRANNNLTVAGSAAVTVTGTGTLTLIADLDSNGTGALVMNSNSSLSSASGNITLSDSGGIDLRTVTSTSGNITASSKDDVRIRTSLGAGGSGTLVLTADNDSSGAGTFIQDSGSSLSTAGGNMTISGASDMTLRTLDAGGGNISITASGSGTDINDDSNNATLLTANRLTLSAGGRIGNTGNGQLDTHLDELDATAGAGSLFLTNDQTLLALNASASGSGNDVTLTASSGDLNIRRIQAADDITLSATGAIEESAPDSDTDLLGDLLTLTAGTGMGAAGTIETDVSSVNAQVTGAGNLSFAETDAVTLTSVTTANGSITFTAGGALTVTNVAASGSGQDVTLNAANGDILLGIVSSPDQLTIEAASGSILDTDAATNNLTAFGNSLLSAGGVIGTLPDPIEVLITGGTLSVSALSQLNGVSVHIAGQVTPSNTLTILGNPPGLVLFNGIDLRAAPSSSVSTTPGFDLIFSPFFETILSPYYARRVKLIAE